MKRPSKVGGTAFSVLLFFLLKLSQSQAQIIPFAFWKAHNLFTWIGGPSTETETGLYGTEGTGSTSNLPGPRADAVSWTDSLGNFWFFGGLGFDILGNFGPLDDMWEYVSGTGQWTWVSGTNSSQSAGAYGTQGTGSTANYPGGRANASGVLDGSGNLWVFGGSGVDSTYTTGPLMDLWEYTPSTKKWTWVSGQNIANVTGFYGTKGTGSISNYPGGRSNAAMWIDGTGNFWLFGGHGYDGAGTVGDLNDLWEYVPGTQKWTWISGASTVNALGTYGTKGTGLTTNTPGARNNPMGWFDGTNLWLFGGVGTDSAGSAGYMNDLWEFTPSTKKWKWVSGANVIAASGTYGTQGTGSATNTPGARNDSTVLKDASGNFWLFGGYGFDSTGSTGNLNDVWEFVTSTSKWTWVSGSNVNSAFGVYGMKGTGSISNIPGSRENSVAWLDTSGNFWFFGGYGADSTNLNTSLADVWEFNPTSLAWSWVGGGSVNSQMGALGTQGTASANNLPPARNMSQSWVDTSGNLWLFGGSGLDNFDGGGLGPQAISDFWRYTVSTGQWTWMGGGATGGQLGTYGAKGTGSTSNIPGARWSGATWTDSSGNFWLFGGQGIDGSGGFGDMNDLWEYTPSNGQWTWLSGPSVANQLPTYGTLGTGSTSNIPGSRDSASTWVDAAGNLWLFGGYAEDGTGAYGFINDLWKYTPSSGKWTWVSGSNVINQNGVYGSQGTGSTSYTPGGRHSQVSWIDSSGNQWLFGGLGYDSGGNVGTINDLWKFNPSNNQWTWVSGSNLVGQAGTYGTLGTAASSNIPGARMNSVAWADLQGNLWLVGGNGNDSSDTSGLLNDVWRFTPSSAQWTWIAGANVVGSLGIYNTLGAASKTGVPGGRSGSTVWRNASGTAWFFGGLGYDNVGGQGVENDLWRFSP